MLRITTLTDGVARVTLKLEGQVVSEWVTELQAQCEHHLAVERSVRLDFAAVTFVDSGGSAMLGELARGGVTIVNCPALMRDLMPGCRFE